MIKALVLDLDNTIFPTKTIDPGILTRLVNMLESNNDRLTIHELNSIKEELCSPTLKSQIF